MFGKLPGILFALLVFTSACSDTSREQGEILQALAVRSTALNSRDVAQYISIVSRHYNDKGTDFIRLKEGLEKNFREVERLAYDADSPSITVTGSSAEATGSYRMKVMVKGKEMTLNGIEHLRLAKEQEGWKIIAGI